MKKRTLAAIALAGVLAVGGISASAARQIAKGNAIGEENACNFAYVDAGISPEDATVYTIDFDYENGTFVYDIDFAAGGVKYDYTVESATGRILSREKETLPGGSAAATQDPGAAQTNPAGQDQPAAQSQPAAKDQPESSASTATDTQQKTEYIGVDAAKAIAFKAAGVSETDATLVKARLEMDDGKQVYEVEFCIPDKTEYEYDIDAYTGEIVSESMEKWDNSRNTAGNSGNTADNVGESASSDNKPASSSESSTQTSAEQPSAAQTPATQTPTAPADTSAPAETQTPVEVQAPAETQNPVEVSASAPAPSVKSEIGVDAAKSIALQHAGVSIGDATFEKARLETDDGRMIYDIEFYVSGVREYDYEIDAYTGEILESESELWETDDDADDHDNDDND